MDGRAISEHDEVRRAYHYPPPAVMLWPACLPASCLTWLLPFYTRSPPVLCFGCAWPYIPQFGPEQLFDSSVWGPTCDSIDCITHDVMLPEMKVRHTHAYQSVHGQWRGAVSVNVLHAYRRLSTIQTPTPHMPQSHR